MSSTVSSGVVLGAVLPKRDVDITANPGLSKNISRLKFKFPKNNLIHLGTQKERR
jgi:hypothetical protein